ncbi:SRPBCC family protein [Leifsonia shinshuensis]|uniref:SRPBCC family protein n=1 Tax=Leifsonia shinshuensis TaxID=150026 RepID=A0A7G6YBY6_9MICO|nr:SRPBCC family protein [Leifsonia shinshuensis]QNE36001.1 SRPBCC family protein [Leifsonia shinshuensis]
MRSFTDTIEIDAPAHDVYATLRAVDAYPAWLGHSMVYRGTRVPTAATTATARDADTYVDSTMVGRMRGELIDDIPDHELRFHQAKPSGRIDALIVYGVEDSGGRTRVTRIGQLTTHGMYRAVEPMFVMMAARESRRTMKALKAHVEHPA